MKEEKTVIHCLHFWFVQIEIGTICVHILPWYISARTVYCMFHRVLLLSQVA